MLAALSDVKLTRWNEGLTRVVFVPTTLGHRGGVALGPEVGVGGAVGELAAARGGGGLGQSAEGLGLCPGSAASGFRVLGFRV
jgi:hypothetical protein